MLSIIKKFSFVLYLSFVLFSTNVFSQNENSPQASSPNACGITRLSIDLIRRLPFESLDNEAKDLRYTYNTPVIIIARLGAKEKSTLYNLRRLRDIKTYFWRTAGLPESLIITAQGERVKEGNGRVEVYYGGVFQLLINVGHKKNLQLLKYDY